MASYYAFAKSWWGGWWPGRQRPRWRHSRLGGGWSAQPPTKPSETRRMRYRPLPPCSSLPCHLTQLQQASNRRKVCSWWRHCDRWTGCWMSWASMLVEVTRETTSSLSRQWSLRSAQSMGSAPKSKHPSRKRESADSRRPWLGAPREWIGVPSARPPRRCLAIRHRPPAVQRNQSNDGHLLLWRVRVASPSKAPA